MDAWATEGKSCNQRASKYHKGFQFLLMPYVNYIMPGCDTQKSRSLVDIEL